MFLRVDVRNYSDLASAFHAVYKTKGRIDFVFANAGVLESCDILAPLGPSNDHVNISPPEPNLAVLDVNLVGVVYTCYLAMHYFSLSGQEDSENKMDLIITGSCLSFYPSALPLYTATKRTYPHKDLFGSVSTPTLECPLSRTGKDNIKSDQMPWSDSCIPLRQPATNEAST